MVEERKSPEEPKGKRKSLKAAVLETGAKFLQDTTPVEQFDIYVVGFHCAKYHPHQQMEAHHYCHQVNEEFLQCVLFDGNTEDANLVGIEYIISERLFNSLPEDEKRYWHPHNYEILSGQLIAPGLPQLAEKEMLKMLVNSYGKTWHVWHTGRHDSSRGEGHDLPLGDPMLMWSFNRDGEAAPGLVKSRDGKMDLDSSERRRQRQDLVDLAHPQCGVDALAGAFPGANKTPPPGVVDSEACLDDPELP